MESVLGRYRNLTILVGVLFLQVLGLAVQVKRSADTENTRLIRIWAVDLITPLERGLVWAQNGSSNLWHNYFFLRGVRAENRQLRDQIEQMRLEEVRLSEDATQARRLQSLLAFKEQFIAKTVAAQVIGSSGSDLSRSIYIDKGSNDGIAPDMAVITAGGIVGKVLHVYPSTSLVLMINDQSSGAGAMLEKSRLQGVLRGTPNGELMLERVMSDETVAVGETVLSSGGDQIFPKGLPVGTVSKVSVGKEMFLNIQVKPAADLSRLEEVLVVTQKREREPVAVSAGRVRAADILAQRLPSVPEKPVEVAGTVPVSGATVTAAKGLSTGAKPQSSNSGKLATAPAAGTAVAVKPTGDAQGSGVGLKKVAQKTAGGDSATADGLGSAGSNRVLSGSSNPIANPGANPSASLSPDSGTNPAANAAPKATVKSADSPAKPAADGAKPMSTPPNPQPPTTEDNPH
ncbi:MAG: rod shape-determining protein MreC [Candidatus Sulfotelmatobacter sp.]|jgi:rod shape-determining protein MreC